MGYARFEEKAFNHPQPSHADLFSEWVTPAQADWVEGMARAFAGQPGKIRLILEALFEAGCWPVERYTDTPYRCDYTPEAWRIIAVWQRAVAEDQSQQGEAA